MFAKGDSTAYTEEAIAASKGLQPGQNGHATNGVHDNGGNGCNGHGHNGSNGHANGNGAAAEKPANGKNGKSNGQKVPSKSTPEEGA